MTDGGGSADADLDGSGGACAVCDVDGFEGTDFGVTVFGVVESVPFADGGLVLNWKFGTYMHHGL